MNIQVANKIIKINNQYVEPLEAVHTHTHTHFMFTK